MAMQPAPDTHPHGGWSDAPALSTPVKAPAIPVVVESPLPLRRVRNAGANRPDQTGSLPAAT